MTSFSESDLNTFSAEFARALFSKRPAWIEFARVDSTNSSKNILVVEVPPPTESRADHPLIIDTERDEITIGFDSYHSHFDWPSFDEECGNPLKFIEDIVCERVVVVSYWKDDKWCGSQTITAEKKLTPPDYISTDANRMKVRSWRGHFSADHALPIVSA
jgi:hypothetical protein